MKPMMPLIRGLPSDPGLLTYHASQTSPLPPGLAVISKGGCPPRLAVISEGGCPLRFNPLTIQRITFGFQLRSRLLPDLAGSAI